MFGPRTNGRHRLVECNQLQSTNSRQMQQRGVRHLSIADDFWHQCLERGCRERWCCFHVLMRRMGDETVEQLHSGLAINRHADHLGIQREAQKSRLRQQAGRPSRGRVASKPAMHRVLMCMVVHARASNTLISGSAIKNPPPPGAGARRRDRWGVCRC
jgi:hypothetical protein